jgi:hypothetical protein
MARKERVCAILCSVAFLLSAGLGNATDIDAKSFRCVTKMTPVRQFYVDNLQGNLDATLAAAAVPHPNHAGERGTVHEGMACARSRAIRPRPP